MEGVREIFQFLCAGTLYETSRTHHESHVYTCLWAVIQTVNPLLPFLPFCKLVNEDFIEAWAETCVLRMMSDITWHMSQSVWVKDEKWATTEDKLQGNKMTLNQNGWGGEGCNTI